ncbi:MAG: mycothiol system anti-sigma-R factor [Mycobacteriaceae bacterium]
MDDGQADDAGHLSDIESEVIQLDCSAVLADVWLMLDNECDEHSRARLQRHMENCGPCFESYGLEEKIKHLISRKCGGEQAPEGLRERLTIEIRSTLIIGETFN